MARPARRAATNSNGRPDPGSVPATVQSHPLSHHHHTTSASARLCDWTSGQIPYAQPQPASSGDASFTRGACGIAEDNHPSAKASTTELLYSSAEKGPPDCMQFCFANRRLGRYRPAPFQICDVTKFPGDPIPKFAPFCGLLLRELRGKQLMSYSTNRRYAYAGPRRRS